MKGLGMKRTYLETAYSKKLRHPKWQKKRLEIMKRDDFSCKKCGLNEDDGVILNVHHCYYSWGKEPWDYPDSSLITLCEACHQEEAIAKTDKQALVEAMCMHGLLSEHFNELALAFYGSRDRKLDDYSISALAWVIHDPNARLAMIDAFGKHLARRNKK